MESRCFDGFVFKSEDLPTQHVEDFEGDLTSHWQGVANRRGRIEWIGIVLIEPKGPRMFSRYRTFNVGRDDRVAEKMKTAFHVSYKQIQIAVAIDVYQYGYTVAANIDRL